MLYSTVLRENVMLVWGYIYICRDEGERRGEARYRCTVDTTRRGGKQRGTPCETTDADLHPPSPRLLPFDTLNAVNFVFAIVIILYYYSPRAIHVVGKFAGKIVGQEDEDRGEEKAMTKAWQSCENSSESVFNVHESHPVAWVDST